MNWQTEAVDRFRAAGIDPDGLLQALRGNNAADFFSAQ